MRRAHIRAGSLALVLVAGACCRCLERGRRVAPTGPSSPQRAPSGPPLVAGGSAPACQNRPEAKDRVSRRTRSIRWSATDSGVRSCRGSLGAEPSSAPADRSNCETSGFLAAPAPTGNYGLDVHIDTGLVGLSSSSLLSVVQDLFVSPLWMSIVWAVHALVVMLEWAFTVDVLDSAMGGGLGAGLREMQAAITAPWLAAVLAVRSDRRGL